MPVVTLAVDLLIAAIQNASAISQLIATAKAQGRDITPAELQTVIDGDNVARANLVLAIAAAKAKGL
jgi:hypothetical protein